LHFTIFNPGEEDESQVFWNKSLCFSLLLIFCQVVYAKTDTIIYETELYGPPFKFIEDGEISGFEIELNQYIFSGSEYRFDYRFNTWEKFMKN